MVQWQSDELTALYIGLDIALLLSNKCLIIEAYTDSFAVSQQPICIETNPRGKQGNDASLVLEVRGSLRPSSSDTDFLS